MIRTTREVNNYKTEWVIDQIKIAASEAFALTGRGSMIVFLGLPFKSDIYYFRESLAVHVASAFQVPDYDLVAVSPTSMHITSL
jgi:UDP-N-acetyl-D-mannosaminuronic acid dehydrogenase